MKTVLRLAHDCCTIAPRFATIWTGSTFVLRFIVRFWTSSKTFSVCPIGYTTYYVLLAIPYGFGHGLPRQQYGERARWTGSSQVVWSKSIIYYLTHMIHPVQSVCTFCEGTLGGGGGNFIIMQTNRGVHMCMCIPSCPETACYKYGRIGYTYIPNNHTYTFKVQNFKRQANFIDVLKYLHRRNAMQLIRICETYTFLTCSKIIEILTTHWADIAVSFISWLSSWNR